jgi:hypothetical protein
MERSTDRKEPNMFHRRWIFLSVSLAVSPAVLGCGSVRDYFRDRLLDLTDTIDLKYGASLTSLGFGGKVEVFSYAGIGLGFGTGGPVTEWYGRKAATYPGTFLHLGVFGLEKPGFMFSSPDYGCWSLLLFQLQIFPKERYPSHALRTGGEVLLPLVRGGVFFNLFEFADFITGWFGLDLAEDDGAPKEVDRVIEEGSHSF